MYIQASNPIVRKKVEDFIVNHSPQSTHLLDVDNVRYLVQGSKEGEPEKVMLSIDSSCREAIAPFVDAMMKERYPDSEGAVEVDQGCTIHIDKTKLPKLMKIKKTMSEEEKVDSKNKNEITKGEIAAQAKAIATHVSCLKRDYMGAPILAAFTAALAGGSFKSLQIKYRNVESYYVFVPAAGEVQVIYGLNFPDKFERVLAKILCVQMKDTKSCKNPPLITYHDKVDDRPTNLSKDFPNHKDEEYTSGMISISKYRILSLTNFLLCCLEVNKDHMSKHRLETLNMLVTFRQYIQFHIQSMKCQLHSSMRKRVNIFETVIKQGRRDKDSTKEWAENFGGAKHADMELKVEEKTGEVYKHK